MRAEPLGGVTCAPLGIRGRLPTKARLVCPGRLAADWGDGPLLPQGWPGAPHRAGGAQRCGPSAHGFPSPHHMVEVSFTKAVAWPKFRRWETASGF